MLLIALALNLIAAALVLSFERDTPNGNIHSYPDALWWAVTTIRILERLDTIEAGLQVDERGDQRSHDSAGVRSSDSSSRT